VNDDVQIFNMFNGAVLVDKVGIVDSRELPESGLSFIRLKDLCCGEAETTIVGGTGSLRAQRW
jgi:hypothetical protein